ncbi:hypothetical protein GCM10023314_31740 [Algibacter agarivorans]|uniref:Secretion system C-terminal sorting domain-containing protein n=1 Tax=Algibacter agarivorans TaxID=1109741 RepID=A0ABP9GWT3_9FLAO
MKKHFLVSFLTLLFASTILYSQTNIPDDNFEAYLETHDIDGNEVLLGDANSLGDGTINNNSVPKGKIANVINLNISNRSISELTGIADFTSLETLICSNNKLTILDVSTNVNLKSLLCGVNQLTDLDLRQLSNLEVLDCSGNQLVALLLQESNSAFNPALSRLTCSNNQLSTIDVGQNVDLVSLTISNNQFDGELVVSNNINLESLFCASNQITILNVSSNTNLKTLDASNNLISTLDLSTINAVDCPNPQTVPTTICQGAASINVSRNQLTSLVVNNGFNNLISTFNSEDNPDLFCIQVDSGFTPPETGSNDWKKDDWTYYSDTTCTDIFTYVPDDNFEDYLETNGLGDDIANNNFVLTARINNLSTLNVSGNTIDNLTGIEDFKDLEILDCSDNRLNTLNVSSNGNLTNINCSNNILPSLDLSANTPLLVLNCSAQMPFVDTQDASNNYTFDTLNVTSNTVLTILNCSNNALAQLDISNNVQLSDLNCSTNQIEALNVTSNTLLTSLLCNNNNLFTLNMKNGQNPNLINLDAQNNSDLACIETDTGIVPGGVTWAKDATAAYNVNCGTYVPDDNFEQALIDLGIDTVGALDNFVLTSDINTLISLDVSSEDISDLTGIEAFIALQDFNCSSNALTSLNLNSNTALTDLNCSNNQIENLDVTLNTLLTSLACDNNALFKLNIKNGTNNTLATFNATNNASLFCINVDDAIIGSISGSWQKDGIASYNGDCDGSRFTAIPDNFFEQALIDLGLDSGPLDNQVLTANIEHVLSLVINDKKIQDLSGIKGFSLLKELDCSGNSLNTLDVSGIVNLEELNCNSNYLLTNDTADTNGLLDITGTVSLKKLFCASNNMSKLDMSANLNLEVLDCANNNLDVLDIASNSLLKTLNCSNNNLASLNISSNLVLEEVNCNNNKILSLTGYAVNNSTLKELSCNSNDLSTLLVNRYLALTTLNCRSNKLSQLIVTSNTALETLDFSDNMIADISLASNINLVSVLASQNELTQLDLNANTGLERLNCDNNQITQLVVDTAPLLKYFSANSNQLTDLDLSVNGNLIEIQASSNMLSSLSLSANLNTLKTFNCNNNQLTGNIDLSAMGTTPCPAPDPNNPQGFCPDSISINVSNNQLDFVNIQNGINNEIQNFNAINNPDITCIQVDDENNIGESWLKDATAQYSIDCRFGETFVPDDNFEQALITLGYDTGALDDYVPTASINTLTALDINGKSISDLTGIEDFDDLQNLNCSNNTLSVIDLSKNINLTEINCSDNTFSDLDFSNNIALTTINCSNNTLSSLDLTANPNITNLNIANNVFIEFTSFSIPTLAVFNCDSNQLVELDFTANASLINLSCQSNVLEILNLKNTQNPSLTNLNAQDNSSLTCIETDTGAVPGGVTWLKDATAQYEINCHYGQTYVPDDAFETALAILGYDSGPLDDYVVTANIETISFLDISNKGIIDLTGIEAFISLTNLNFSENTITNIDLSDNILLDNLDASNNTLAAIDLSFAPNLRVVNLSNNVLAQLNLDANINVINLNVASNSLTSLNVGLLVNLEILNCSINQLGSLDMTLNPNLKELYCQTNLFIQDKLNIQNGANQNLVIFSAINNPDLRCILVDDPFTVISNTNGSYDDWYKDATANYQTICADADNDGISNAEDQCPNTSFGSTVDLFGCPILSLPNNNFTIQITSETCLNNNNGKINIATLEYYNYTATLTKDNFSKAYKFTNDIDILNLLAGTYKMCITIEEWPNYMNCYDVVISQPEPLSVSTNKSTDGKKVSIKMSGSSSYNVDFNGLTFSTNDSNITLNLQEGANAIKVSTDIECQGVHEERILVSDKVIVYPNPFQDKINMYLGENDTEKVVVNMYSYLGQLVYSKTLTNQKSGKISLDTNNLALGIYTISIQTNTSLSTFKIIKK